MISSTIFRFGAFGWSWDEAQFLLSDWPTKYINKNYNKLYPPLKTNMSAPKGTFEGYVSSDGGRC